MPVAVFEFGDFKLDCDRFELTRAGRSLRLERKPMELLILLATRNGQLVTRTEIAERLWGTEVFVDTEHGINTAIRKIRHALGDDFENPRFVQTVTGKGYRFAAPILPPEQPAEPMVATQPNPKRQPLAWSIVATLCSIFVIVGVVAFRSRPHPHEVRYTQLTDFTDSAVSPALSPDGRMLAFIRGSDSFMSADQIYVKMLPDGEARRLTDDKRLKYGLAFSPNGSEIAYTVLETPGFSTYTVSVLGGDSHLFLKNAAGLSWLSPNQILFSRIKSGIHLGVVTGTATGDQVREIYFPSHERGMAHFSFPSPDRKWILVVEMNQYGDWAPCRLVSLEGQFQTKSVGPSGRCTAAGWSPDGSWMYFAAALQGHSHLWRQHFPDGSPQQITFGPTDDQGLAVEPSGQSLITSVGAHESEVWIHDPTGDRPLSSEGEVMDYPPPVFSQNDTVLYYLLQREPEGSGAELWRTTVESGKSEAAFPGISMLDFDVSPDGKRVVYVTSAPGGKTQLWLAPVDRSSPPSRVGNIGGLLPHFGPEGQIVFERTEGNANYLEQVRPDGSGLSKVVPYSIIEIQSVSPGRRWLMAVVPSPPGVNAPAIMGIPLDGGPPRRICTSYCLATWSSSGNFLFISVEASSRTSPGRSLAIPIGPGETLPNLLPPGGIEPMADASTVPGAQSFPRADLVPGKDLAHFAYVKATVHRNLYRISLP